MLKELSIDNWILAGTGFLIIFAVGCFFWYQSVMAQLQPKNTDHNYDTRQVEKSNHPPKIEATETSREDATDSHSTDFDVTSNVSVTRQENTRSRQGEEYRS